MRLQYAREIARLHNEQASDTYKFQHDAKSEQHKFQVGQLVLLQETQFQGQNRKLAMNYSGPHRILKLVHENNAELLQANGKKLLVHVNRLKPYIVPPDKIDFKFPPIDWDLPVKPVKKEVEKKLLQTEVQDFPSSQPNQSYQEDFGAMIPTPSNIQTEGAHDEAPVPVKRGRGRPKKTLAPNAQPSIAQQPTVKFKRADPPVFQRGEGMSTRSRSRVAAQADPSEDIQSGPFLPVQDEFATEVVELIQRTIVEGIKRAKARSRARSTKFDGWTKRQKALFRATGDIYDHYKYASQTHSDYIPPSPVASSRASSVGPDSESSDLDTDPEEVDQLGGRGSDDTESGSTVRRRLSSEGPSEASSSRPASPQPTVPTGRSPAPTVTSPAVRAFQNFLQVGKPSAKATDQATRKSVEKFLDLQDPRGYRPPIPPAVQQRSNLLFQDLEDISRRQSGLPRTPPQQPTASTARPKTLPAPPDSPPPRPKSAPSGAARPVSFDIPNDPRRTSTSANPFARSARLTRSPPTAASTRSKSAAPAIPPLPRKPIERKATEKKPIAKK
jgi:hypothetical protein